MSKATTVQIHTSEITKYQTIIRGAMSAAKAAKELNHLDEAEELMEIKHWADKKLDYAMKA